MYDPTLTIADCVLRLNIFLPIILFQAASGGPNTAYQIRARCTDKIQHIVSI
jgi:hypothetical protein